MPRLYSNQASEARTKRVVSEALTGKPPKAIAFDNDLAEHSLRKILWAHGFRCMMLTAQERAVVAQMRAGLAACGWYVGMQGLHGGMWVL